MLPCDGSSAPLSSQRVHISTKAVSGMIEYTLQDPDSDLDHTPKHNHLFLVPLLTYPENPSTTVQVLFCTRTEQQTNVTKHITSFREVITQ